MKQTPTILMAGGGSGGHITPLLSLARELKRQSPGCKVVYVGHKGDKYDGLKTNPAEFDCIETINAGKYRRYHGDNLLTKLFDFKTWLLNFRDLFRLPGSILASKRIIKRYQPEVLFSKGSFVAVPVGIAAKRAKIPIVTHDSDSMPGLANRIVGRWAVIHATGMPAKYYDYPEAKVRFVGVPIPAGIKKVTPGAQAEAKAKLGYDKADEILLLSGGGNGSRHLNELLAGISRDLLAANPALRIIHLTGVSHEEPVKDAYTANLSEEQLSKVRLMGFSSDFPTLSAAADLVIGRAGATTLAELAAAGKACVIIPAPFLAGGHQLKNASELTERDAAVVLDDSLSADELLAVLNELLSDKSRRSQLADNLHAMAKPDAGSKLAEVILEVAGRGSHGIV